MHYMVKYWVARKHDVTSLLKALWVLVLPTAIVFYFRNTVHTAGEFVWTMISLAVALLVAIELVVEGKNIVAKVRHYGTSGSPHHIDASSTDRDSSTTNAVVQACLYRVMECRDAQARERARVQVFKARVWPAALIADFMRRAVPIVACAFMLLGNLITASLGQLIAIANYNPRVAYAWIAALYRTSASEDATRRQ